MPWELRYRNVVAAAALVGALALPGTADAATITVTTTADGVAADGECSLREAVNAANSDGAVGGCSAGLGQDLVALGAGTYTLSRAGGFEDVNSTGDLDITSPVTIEGAGAGVTTIDAGGIDRAIDVKVGASAAVQALTITGGHAPDGSDPGDVVAPGAGMDANADVGGAGSNGGAIRSDGTLIVTSVALVANQAGAGGPGGDAFASAGAAATPGSGGNGGTGGTAAGGSGGNGGNGGAIYSTGPLTVSDSVLRDNRAGSAGRGGSAIGGDGGTGGSGSPNGGGGGSGRPGSAGSAGNGGNGGGIVSNGGGLTLRRTTLAANRSGDGGTGGRGEGGEGGVGGTGAGGTGGFGGNGSGGIASAGGDAGTAGGLALVTGFAEIVNVTMHGNQAGSAGAGGEALGGDGGRGGNGSLGGNGGAGGDGGTASSGDGGDGGDAGATFLNDGSLHNATVVANSPGAPGAGGAAETGSGGDGGPAAGPGATGAPGSPGLTITGAAGAAGAPGGLAGDYVLFRSIVASNVSGNCAGTFAADGVTIAFPSGCNATRLLDPQLGPLEDNGGVGPTLRPLPGSPARDSTGNCGAGSTDQRGVARPTDFTCDVGAYEAASPAATTGDASSVTSSSAALGGTVTPNARAASVRFEYGTTTAYGSSTPAADSGSGVSTSGVTHAVGGLAPSTTYHFRIVASTPDGTATGEDRAFTTPAVPPVVPGGGGAGGGGGGGGPGGGGPGGGVADTVGPAFRSASLTRSRLTSKKGTTIRWSLSEAATMSVTVQQLVPGRRSGRRCVKPTKRLRRAKKCTRTVNVGTLKKSAQARAGSLAFNGRVGRKRLKPGKYQFRLVATDAAGNASAERLLKFSVARG